MDLADDLMAEHLVNAHPSHIFTCFSGKCQFTVMYLMCLDMDLLYLF